MYDLMAGMFAGSRGVKRHRRLSRNKVMELAPALVTERLKEGFIYYDAQTNDARLTLALIRTAAQFGATIANYAEVTSFVTENGKVTGAHVRDQLGNQDITVRARHIVNATGVFSEQIEELAGYEPQVQVKPSKGIHLVFSCEDVKLGDDAIVLPETDDKRILFLVPWESRAIFGTTDTGSGDLDHPTATQEDISYLLNHLKRYLSVQLTEESIISVYAGYRPLLSSRGTGSSTAKLSRTHAVLQSPSGLVTIVGGKLTTYRRMAQDTVDVLSRRDGSTPIHPTQNLPLQGSAGWLAKQRDVEIKGLAFGLSPQTIKHLRHYGSEALALLKLIEDDPELGRRIIDDLPYIRAEVIYSCRHEMAMTPNDVLGRRTAIMLEDRQRGIGAVDDVASLMAGELNWSPEQQQLMSDAFRSNVQQQLAAEKEYVISSISIPPKKG
jgi:glycerol-3-phosphate dehydrogenase